jgi:hypothetical protein
MEVLQVEKDRLQLQKRLDTGKTQAERNKIGQFATPTNLARDILQFGLGLLGTNIPIRFLDPALGTGSFYSALIHSVSPDKIEVARGYELDPKYIEPVRTIWQGTNLDVILGDFTQAEPPQEEINRFNLLICNPPYVRHHHILNGDKLRLKSTTEKACGIRINGLAGLYCYFIGIAHAWMQSGGIAGWLIPSEFMDVNYGAAVKQYLLEKVSLIRIHRFDPNEVQFEDALVSSAVVWFRNNPPSANQQVEFTYGGSLLSPKITRLVSSIELAKEGKWTRFPISNSRERGTHARLSSLFNIKRGIATGHNRFFILTEKQIREYELPMEAFRPILPSPRYIQDNEIEADRDGLPILDRKLYLLNCRLSEDEISTRYPRLWEYLEKGRKDVSSRYLCKTRKQWYWQEERQPAPILCTYLGRSDSKNGRPFRFIFNHSSAIAANVYLLLYPTPFLKTITNKHPETLRKIWQALNNLEISSMLEEGRVYGGGLHKLEPKELGNIDISVISSEITELQDTSTTTKQLQLQFS